VAYILYGNGGTTQSFNSKDALNMAILLGIEWENGMDRFVLRILIVKEESLIEKGICKFSCSRCISFIDYI